MAFRPGQGHQPSPTSAEHDGPLCEAAVARQLIVKRRVEPLPLRTAVRLADVDPCNGYSGFQKPFEHPLLFGARVWRKRWRIPDPGRRALAPLLRRYQKSLMTLDCE